MDKRDSLDRSSTELAPTNSSVKPSASNGGGGSLFGGDSPKGQQVIDVANDPSPAVNTVLQSDIGINTLLTRLKQSIASAREFSAFLKKRSTLEEEHAQGLKKLCRSSHEATRRPDNRQGSYAQNYDETIRIHDRMADNGVQFALSLHQMHEDLHDLAANMERGRKHWKQNGLSAEKRVQDSESMMEKAKTKYDSLAEDYDRARTGDKQAGRVFGLKGPKSAAQHEEDLNRKVQAADSDYQSKVQLARSQRQELVSTLRPQAVKSLLDLIGECDAGLTLQLQKFASINEKLLLGNGLCVSPLNGQNNNLGSRSLRDVVCQIDNTKDLDSYISSFASKAGGKNPDVRYERHATLTSSQQTAPASLRVQPMSNPQPSSSSGFQGTALQAVQVQGQAFSPTAALPATYASAPNDSQDGSPKQQYLPQMSSAGPPQLPTARPSTPLYSQASTPTPTNYQNDVSASDMPVPSRPVFGLSLENLLRRDGSAIPLVVYQCLQAVDLFGLEVEGIYRLSGSAAHVAKLRAVFDYDSSQVDFRNPESFYHDVNSVAGLLKQFFRDLPDPLLTREHYQSFIEAARIDDDILRRDSLHATINGLPDPNYATLRALTLHLNRVQEHSETNRMNAGNLAICFGPTLMGSSTGPNISDAGWQVRVIDTILQNTYQIFDDD
ncbi:MAG: hypothetical protein Q9195_004836 [Heterodermia aff. obscurata]